MHDKSDPHSGVKQIDLPSWTDFYQLVAQDFAGAPNYVFRGHAHADWRVESSLDRWERLHAERQGGNPPVSRAVHLRAFRQATRAMSPIQLPKDDDALTWALAQHHGLRTPLLDWSLSPFVALYFAFEDELVETDGRLVAPPLRSVLALSTSAIANRANGAGGVFPRVYSPSGPVSQRLLAQSSLFLMMPEHTDLESVIQKHWQSLSTNCRQPGAPILQKFNIPSEGRRDCLKMLNKMNINRLTLFPDLDGAARYINGLWDLDFDSGLGFFEDAHFAGGSHGAP
jgi:hypothetical protein